MEITSNHSIDKSVSPAVENSFPGQIHETPGGGIVLSKLDDVINWARSNSL